MAAAPMRLMRSAGLGTLQDRKTNETGVAFVR
jgi:hypothetical protein